jgi:hypothetical protein
MKIEKGESKNVELVGYHDLDDRPGFQMAMQVVDGNWFLYLAHFWHKGWTIMDVTEPSDPKLVRFVPWEGGQDTITIKVQVADGKMIANLQREIALLAHEGAPFEEGILIFDVKEDPVDPKLLGHWKSGGEGTHRNYYDGGRYVHTSAGCPGFYGNIYRIIDIEDPTNPVEAGRWWLPEQWGAGQVPTEEEEKFGGPAKSYLQSQHHRKYSLHGPPYPKGDRVYLNFFNSAVLAILDISNIALPQLISKLQFNPPFGNMIAGHTAMPLSQRDLLLYTTEGTFQGFGGQLDIAGIVDISDEKHPRLISTLPVPEPPPGSPYKNFHEKAASFGPHNFHEPHNHPDLEDRNDRVYLTYFNAGLRIYDISDPYLPREIAYYIPPDPTKRNGPMPRGKLGVSSEDILVDKRGYIYMTDKNLGLHVLRCTI